MCTVDMHMDSPAENTRLTFGNNVGFFDRIFPRLISIVSPLKVSKCFVNYPFSVTQQASNKWIFPD